jgi:hypothetical protein
MKIKNLFILACLAYATIVNGAGQPGLQLPDVEASHEPAHIAARAPVTASGITGVLTPATRGQVVNLLSEDNERNVADLIQTRWCFRKVANYTNVIGNTSLYFGSAASAVAAASSLIFPPAVPYILWSGATCFAIHVLGIGIAKCSAAQEDVREQQLKTLAQGLGMSVIPVAPVVIDGDGTAHPNAVPVVATSAVSGTGAHLPPPPAITLLSSRVSTPPPTS